MKQAIWMKHRDFGQLLIVICLSDLLTITNKLFAQMETKNVNFLEIISSKLQNNKFGMKTFILQNLELISRWRSGEGQVEFFELDTVGSKSCKVLNWNTIFYNIQIRTIWRDENHDMRILLYNQKDNQNNELPSAHQVCITELLLEHPDVEGWLDIWNWTKMMM